MDPLEVVLDTNVFVSALRSRSGASFRLLELMPGRSFSVNLSVALVLEYEAVGLRHLDAAGLSDSALRDLLDFMCQVGKPREVHYSWRPALPDPGDDMILELAVAAGGAAIVTFNAADFAGAERFGVRVLRPQDLLAIIGGAA